MKYLLDTHILLWARLAPDKLSEAHRAILASAEDEKFISSVTLWELSLKYSVGKLDLGGHTPEEFISGMYNTGVRSITPTEQQYVTFYLLPKVIKHKDPFDRMIICQAMKCGLTLVSSDNKLPSYEIHGLTTA